MLESALHYASQGYPVFPLRPGTSRPATEHGHNEATTDARQIRYWWSRDPAMNVGIACTGLVVIDLDPGSSWPPDPEHQAELADAPTCSTPRGGTHHYYRRPQGVEWKCSVSLLAPNVDVRTDGGYVVAPPSVRPDGWYQWIEGLELDPPFLLKEPPLWLAEALDGVTAGRHVPLRDEVPDLIPEGRRNTSLFKFASHMRSAGLSASEILAGLEAINESRCRPPIPARELRQIAEHTAARYDPNQAREAFIYGWWDEQRCESILPPDFAAPAVSVPPPAPAHVEEEMPAEFYDAQRLGPLLGGFIDWTLKCSSRPMPILALAAGIPMVGTLAGRKIEDDRRTRTNIYTFGVAASGAGKNTARRCVKELLVAAGAESLVGQEDIASSAGLFSMVEKQPAVLSQIDEVGRLLAAIAGAGEKSPHLFHIGTLLIKLFSDSNTVFLGSAYADAEKNGRIDQPNLCVYGTTVPSYLHKGLTTQAIIDGFLPRFLIFESPPGAKRKPESKSPPESLLSRVRAWNEFLPGGNLAAINPRAQRVECTAGAEDAYDELDALAESEAARLGEPLGSLWTRAVEKARKLGLILWASHNAPVGGRWSPAPVTEEMSRWACDLSAWVTRRMVESAARHVAESLFDTSRLRVLRIIEEAGEDGATRSRILRRFRGINKTQLDQVLDTLRQSEEITRDWSETNGRRCELYRLTK